MTTLSRIVGRLPAACGALGLALGLQGCVFGSDEKSPIEERTYAYVENRSIKDTTQIWDFAWLEHPDTVAWVTFYPSDSLVFSYSYWTERPDSMHDFGYAEDLFFVIPPDVDSFRIEAQWPKKMFVDLRCTEPVCGFKPVLSALISGRRTGSTTYLAEGTAIYSLAASPDSVSTAGRDTIVFSGTFKRTRPSQD